MHKNEVTLNQYGFRQGGPIVIPGLYNGRGKAFFFFNYEKLTLPNNFSRTRFVLNPLAQQGIFQYTTSSGTQQVNLYTLAASRGEIATADSTTASVLSAIRSATQTTGTITQLAEPNVMSYDFLSPGNQFEKQVTGRLDHNLGSKHRLTGTFNWQVVDRNPDHLNGVDVRFPGLPNFRHYLSYRELSSVALRSAFTGNLVNELRGGIKWGPSFFGKPEWNGPDTFSNMGGRALVLGNVGGSSNLTNLTKTITRSTFRRTDSSASSGTRR